MATTKSDLTSSRIERAAKAIYEHSWDPETEMCECGLDTNGDQAAHQAREVLRTTTHWVVTAEQVAAARESAAVIAAAEDCGCSTGYLIRAIVTALPGVTLPEDEEL